MTIVERITHIRKEQHITQEEMAKKLNIKQGSLSDIERGKVNVVTDRVINDICREYKINKEWLKTGHGEMLKTVKPEESSNELIDLILFHLDKGNLDEMDKKFISEYIKLNPKYRNIIKDFIRKIID